MGKTIKKIASILGITVSLAGMAATPAKAQSNCGCDFEISASTTSFDGAAKGVKPGDVICIKAGKGTNIYFKNIKGAQGNPVTIKNCGGRVEFGGTNVNNGIFFTASRYVRLTGTGDASQPYGIFVNKTKDGSQGVGITGQTSDIEVDHLEITGAGFAGIMAKTDPSCDKANDRPNFTMYNVLIHDNYIHDIGGEGIYLGNSFYNGTTVYCSQTSYPHEVRGVRVYNNRVENTGWEAIQVGSAVDDVEIYDNKVLNYGQANKSSQNNGIQLGIGTSGKCYNNYIENGYGNGLVIQGIGDNLVYNNVLVGTGSPAFTVNTRPTPLSTDIVSKGFKGGVYIVNNTIVDTKNVGAFHESINDAPGNVLYNNLVVTSASNWDQMKTYTDWKKANNVIVNSNQVKFVNAGNKDFRLASGSPAIDAGRDISSFGINYDFDMKSRANGSTDAGAFEYGGTSTANQAPTVNAGADQTVTLPNNSASFTAKATDNDGSIASYSWSKVSGPSVSLSGQSSDKLTVTNLVAGTYTFRVTAKDDKGAAASDDVNLIVEEEGVTTGGGTNKVAGGNGLRYKYFEGFYVSVNDFLSHTPVKQGEATEINLNTRNRDNNFGFIFEGAVEVPQNGSYTFYTNSDEGSALFINGKKIVDNDGLHSVRERSGSIDLTAGQHEIKVVYFDRGGGEHLDVKISGPGVSKQVIPASMLYKEVSSSPVSVAVSTDPIFRIDCGGGANIAASLLNWSLDNQPSPSKYLDPNANNNTAGASSWNKENKSAAPDEMFATMRIDYQWGGNVNYAFPVDNGEYTVKLYFAESPYSYGAKAAGDRVFDIAAEGKVAVDNLDIFKEAGLNAVEKVITVNVTDGKLNLELIRQTGNPIINGIEIAPAGTVATASN